MLRDGLLHINRTSLANTALNNSLFLKPCFEVVRAAMEVRFWSNGTSRTFLTIWPARNVGKASENCSTVKY
jgi:hypothetical protein